MKQEPGNISIADAKPGPHEEAKAFWNDRLGENPDESVVGCAGFGRQYNRWLYRLRAAVFRRAVNQLGSKTSSLRVLDVGSGTGFYISQWQALGVRDIEGLDFTETGVQFLQRQFPGYGFHLADIGDRDLNIAAGAYDVISAFDVLFHIVDDERYNTAIRNLSRSLKPGGVLLLSENFVHHERPRVSAYHYSRTLESIERLLNEAGLEIENRLPMFALMNAPDDSKSPWLQSWWRLYSAIARRGEVAGWATGALLYPLERVLTSVMSEGPSTELAFCRKTDGKDPGALP